MSNASTSTLSWLTVLLTVFLGLHVQAEAANSRLCVKNIGDAPVKAAVIYMGAWGGWEARGWWLLEPSSGFFGTPCVHIPENDHDGAIFHYLAFTQKGADGEWHEAAFDIKEVEWIDDETGTVGASYTLVPRSTLESGQYRGTSGETDYGGVKVVTCIAHKGDKELANLNEQRNCGPGEVLALFGTKFYTPTSGGIFQTNDFDVYVSTSKNATLFDLSSPTTETPKKEPPTESSNTVKPKEPYPQDPFGSQKKVMAGAPKKPGPSANDLYFVLAHLMAYPHPLGIVRLIAISN